MRDRIIIAGGVAVYVAVCVFFATHRPPPLSLAESERQADYAIGWAQLNILAINRVIVSRGGTPLPLLWGETR